MRIASAADLYGYQLVVTFDPANIEATAAAFDDSFLTNPLGSPAGWDATIDNTNGKVYYARTRQYPDAGPDGQRAAGHGHAAGQERRHPRPLPDRL